ncbi:unnamed protein product [Chrysodeixis includens]|uniref:WD repeat-containing protein 74 n=1 Tax=Chrysodeixis includens TaxID=689277 RepID=A0A9P0FU41_CHRIL|nr:unnamed protein product [Chrysodeixis includens]
MKIEEDKEVDIFVASRIGSFKHIKYHTDPTKNCKKNIENLINIKDLRKDDSITRLEWGNAEQTEILVGKKNQQIQLYSTISGFTKSFTADFAPGHIVGLGRSKGKIVAALSSGVVKLWTRKHKDLINVGKLDRMRMCPDDDTVFATGGDENDLKIWRLDEAAPTFTAKNLPHDWLQLRRAVWVSDLALLPGEGGRLAAVCSRHGYVRLYDTRAQRRPVINVDFENMAATCIATSFDERQVLVGFGRGQLHQVDLRKGKPDKGYKGAAGAVTDIAAVRHGRLIVSCSLDRQIRVHDYASKELVYQKYLTSKLSCLLVQEARATPLARAEGGEVKEEEEQVKVEAEGERDDLDALFEMMDTVGEKPKKKKLPNLQETELPAKKIRPSTGGSTDTVVVDTDDAIRKLLRSTEKEKKRREQRKREKKAKSVFHNA